MAAPGIASKNLYELLGNDPELDPDRAPEPPTIPKDNPVNRIGKRNGPAEVPAPAPSANTGAARGGNDRRNQGTGNERAYNARNAGAYENRRRAPDDGLRQDRHPDRIRADRGEYRGKSRGRGGGMARGGARIDDRRSKTGIQDHEKQLAHGWGGNTGAAEQADEEAGAAIAKEEEKEGFDTTIPPPVDAEGNAFVPDGEAGATNDTPAEPEGPKSKGYDEYLAELTEKKAALGQLSIRQANEGSAKKFPEGKAFARDETQENFFIGGAEKKQRERTKKEVQRVELDADAMRPQEEPRSSRGGRGGRGGPRRDGDRPERREPREPREPREGDSERPRGRGGRGGDRPRGDRPRGDGAPRGRGRGGASQSGPNISDSSAFPSLGA